MDSVYTIKLNDFTGKNSCPKTVRGREQWCRLPGWGFQPVLSGSPPVWRKEVLKLARYFRREFRYDFVQYSFTGENDINTQAYTWLNDTGIMIGACCFRERVYESLGKIWCLDWVWFHPYERNKGHLKEAWPHFRKQYGIFHCEHPLSRPMTGFIAKYHPEQLERERKFNCPDPITSYSQGT